jgi:type IV pilus assembly protein PilN
MRISINLASRPFVELRPLLARLRLAMIVLAVLATGLGVWAHSLGEKARIATAQMDAIKARTDAVNAERARNEARMRQPRNRGVLDRAVFLNQLFAEKSFSWTAVMMDLERVLPPGVQVTSIEPNILKEGGVLIRLRVTGDRDKTIELVRNLERSRRFAAPRLAGETALTAERAKALGGQGGAPQMQNVSAGALALGSAVEFEIFSGYVPLGETEGARAEHRAAKVDEPAEPSVYHQRHPVVVGPAVQQGVRR